MRNNFITAHFGNTFQSLIIGSILGILLTPLVLLFSLKAENGKAYEEGEKKIEAVVEETTFSKTVIACRAFCYKPPEKVVIPKRRVTSGNIPGVTRLADLPKKIKNPNSIRISLAEAPPIASEVEMINGKGVCGKKNDKGKKSSKNPKGHIDRQCCLDPDEIPNPRCLYR